MADLNLQFVGNTMEYRTPADDSPSAIPDCPLAAMALNDSLRRADVPDGHGSGLWSVTALHGVAFPQRAPGIPIFAPNGWHDQPDTPAVTQAEYTQRFNEEFPIIASILPIDNVVVAGGAAAWALSGNPDIKASDVDLFIVGIDPADTTCFWHKVHEVTGKLRHAIDVAMGGDAIVVIETLSPGLITLVGFSALMRRSCFSLQVILRTFPSVSAMLHGFDVPSCCVAYDGHTAVLTGLAAWAHSRRVNLVNPAYGSTTFEQRIIKYFKRGFALGLPNLYRGAFNNPTNIKGPYDVLLTHITLQTVTVFEDSAEGTLRMRIPLRYADIDALESDYAPDGIVPLALVRQLADANGEFDTQWLSNYVLRANLRQLSAGSNRFMRSMAFDLEALGPEGYSWFGAADDYRNFAIVPPTLSDIFSAAQFHQALDLALKGPPTLREDAQWRQLNPLVIRRDFGLTAQEVGELCVALSATLYSNPESSVCVVDALAPFAGRVMEKYQSLAENIDWRVPAIPSHRYTASLAPRVEDQATWYGEEWVEDDPEVVFTAPPSDDPAEPTDLDLVCTLCMLPILGRGHHNTITLGCGHSFHWNSGKTCGGLLQWYAGHNTCPTCRGLIGRADGFEPTTYAELVGGLDAPDVEVGIEW